MQLDEMRGLSVPFGTHWYRCQSCTVGKRKGDWVFYFSGKVTTYEVTFDLYEDFLELVYNDPILGSWDDLEGIELDGPLPKPSENIVCFFRKWGPLGLFYLDAERFFIDRESREFMVDAPRAMYSLRPATLDEYWKQFHTRKLSNKIKLFGEGRRLLNFANEDVFDGYYERWDNDVWEWLSYIHDLIRDYEEREPDSPSHWPGTKTMLDYYNRMHLFGSSLHPILIQTDDKKHEWSFSFNNLVDALLALQGQKIIGKVNMKECPNCHKRFDTISTGRRRFCSDTCSMQFSNKQRLSDPFYKDKRKLQERIRRRALEIGEEKAEVIKSEISQAKTQKDLKAIEKKYKTILERRNLGR